MKKIAFIILGILFGAVMYKAEAASWFRVYEMFNFQSFHMYGFIGTALGVGLIGTQLMKRKQTKNVNGNLIKFSPKDKSIWRYLLGGTFFGLGWALIGACPGPIFALLGSGLWSMLIVIVSALLGTYLYGIFRNKLPH